MDGNNDSAEVAPREAECEPGLSQNSGLSALAPRVLFRDDGECDGNENGTEVDGGGAEGRGNDSNESNEREGEDAKMGGANNNGSTRSSSEDDSSSGDESSSSGSDSDDEGAAADDSGSIANESIEDDGLSDYERLRLRNIRRNQARLARLGLLGHDGSSSASTGLLAPTDAGAQSKPSNKRKKKAQPAAPVPRRSLPRRRCAKLQRRSFGDENDDNDGHESDESSAASPVKIRHILRPQPHQEARLAEEGHLKQYLRTRRIRRGRPKREEYEYRCDETCGECGGEWRFDNNPGEDKENDNDGSDEDEDVEEATRLVRCKGCRKAFHVGCMLIHGKGEGGDEAEEDDDRKPATVEDESLERPDGRDPKRCHRCEAQYRRQKSSGSSNLVLSLLEASIGAKTVRVRVTPEPALVAMRDGVACRVTLSPLSLGGMRSNGSVNENNADHQRKSVSWSDPLEEEEKELPKCAATNKIRKLVARALSDGGNARLHDHSCEALRRHMDDEASTAATIKLGGISGRWRGQQ